MYEICQAALKFKGFISDQYEVNIIARFCMWNSLQYVYYMHDNKLAEIIFSVYREYIKCTVLSKIFMESSFQVEVNSLKQYMITTVLWKC